MVTEQRQTAPYAPVANVLGVIRRLRERGLPEVLGLPDLERVGVPEGNAPRTLAALKFLGLVGEDDSRTEAFERLGRAPTNEYPEALAEIVRRAYQPVFTVIDPAEDSEIVLHDAFRHYEPQGQRERMVTLFLGLCQEAEIVEGGPPERRPRQRRRQTVQPTGIPSEEQVGQPSVRQRPPAQDGDGADYRLLAALMQQLPKDGKWTKAKRDKWISAVSAGVDLLVEQEDGQEEVA